MCQLYNITNHYHLSCTGINAKKLHFDCTNTSIKQYAHANACVILIQISFSYKAL